MSRATSRAAIKAYVSGKVAGITNVFESFPTVIGGDQITAGADFGAIIVIHLDSDRERRIALGGATSGQKQVDHTATLQVFFRQNPGGADDVGLVAIANFDRIIDDLKALIRADRTLGSSNVWQASEDLACQFSEPRLNVKVVEIWGAVTFTLIEMIAA